MAVSYFLKHTGAGTSKSAWFVLRKRNGVTNIMAKFRLKAKALAYIRRRTRKR